MKLDYLELYSSLVRANSLLPESNSIIVGKIEEFKNTIVNEPGNPDHYINEYYDGISSAIYKIAHRTQSYVDDLKRLSSNASNIRGITQDCKINVMLLGETSSGKTSFLERIYGENCGDTGPNPITAFAVIHKITSLKSYLQVVFNRHFCIDDEVKAEEFRTFLKKYDFYHQFRFDKTVFDTDGEEFALTEKDKFLNFINEANDFPTAFDRIVWHHKESARQVKFTKYADFIDMPGSGGMNEHSENIENSMQVYSGIVDVVLYLLKSDQGVPSSYNHLKTVKRQLGVNNHLFCFVYQIDNRDDFSDKVEALKNFINKDETTDAIEPFDHEERNYFSNALVVDARGPKKEQVKANIALASILKIFFITRGRSFYNSLKAINTPVEFKILEVGGDNIQKINSHLFAFLEDTVKKCIGGKLPLIDDVKVQFKASFCVKKFDYTIYNKDLQDTLIKLYKKIWLNIDSLFGYLGTNYSKSVPIFGTSKPNCFDPTKYNNDFYEKYKEEEGWKSLMYDIQVLHWLRLSYDGNQLKDVYARTAADSIQRTFIEYVKRMESIENIIPVVYNLVCNKYQS